MSDKGQRLDQMLVEQGFAPSRTKAQELIKTGSVRLTRNGQIKEKINASFKAFPEDEIQILSGELIKYVSRAGLKLEGAIKKVQLQEHLDLEKTTALDVGQSTGGFTDCLLQLGIANVFGIDVGHGQLDEKLTNDPRVQAVEGLNVKDMLSFVEDGQFQPVDLIVMDVSFISIQPLFKILVKLLKPGGYILSLVKPQFELGLKSLDKRGLVKECSPKEQLLAPLQARLESAGLQYLDFFESSLKGKTGNQEYFIFCQK